MLAFFAFIGSPLGKLVGFGALALVLLLTLAGVKHEWDQGRVALREVRQIAQTSRKEQAAVARVDRTAAVAEPKAQEKIVVRYRTLVKEIPRYVTSAAPCVPWSVVRLHDAAVLGVDPSTLQPPAGQSDDACSDVDAAALVAGVVANYRAAEQNAEQLNALEASLRARQKAVEPASVVAPAPPVK